MILHFYNNDDSYLYFCLTWEISVCLSLSLSPESMHSLGLVMLCCLYILVFTVRISGAAEFYVKNERNVKSTEGTSGFPRLLSGTGSKNFWKGPTTFQFSIVQIKHMCAKVHKKATKKNDFQRIPYLPKVNLKNHDKGTKFCQTVRKICESEQKKFVYTFQYFNNFFWQSNPSLFYKTQA